MAWRDTFLRYFGPGLLGGITAGDWVKRLRDNHFAVAPSCLNRVMAITLHSLQNSVYRRFEQWRYGPKLKDVVVQSPLFLLGHWRHGTTHLHNLMTVDERFAFANNYQALFPHSFLSTEASASRLMGFFMPKRRPMDNVEWNLQSPRRTSSPSVSPAANRRAWAGCSPNGRNTTTDTLLSRASPRRKWCVGKRHCCCS